MAMTFKEIQDEVARRATKNQSGGAFTTPIQTLINTSLLRIGREAPWRALRRKTSFNVNTSYTTGSGHVTANKGSTTVTVTGATFITDGIEIGRRVKISGCGTYFQIAQITSETTLVLNIAYSGTSTTTATYEILGQETYNMPAQVGTRSFLWHEMYGFPFRMKYTTDFDFYRFNTYVYMKHIPVLYRMWGEDMVQTQLRQPSVVSVVSSSASDTSSIQVMVMGVVNGYPDSELLTLSGTTPVDGSKVFSSVERVSKSAATTGLLTITGNAGTDTVAVIPVGNITSGIQYKKIQLWPLPSQAGAINIQYYKDPYKLVNDYDVHELGQEYDEALILLSVAKLRADTNQAENTNIFQYYQDEINNLKKTNVDKIDWMPTLERPFMDNQANVMRGLKYMQAGSWFGPASYL